MGLLINKVWSDAMRDYACVKEMVKIEWRYDEIKMNIMKSVCRVQRSEKVPLA